VIKNKIRGLLKNKGALMSCIIVFSIVFVDQLLKVFIKTTFNIGEEFQITDWFILHFLENNGFAFGYEFFGKPGKLILTLFRLGASVFIFFWLNKLVVEYNNNKIGWGAVCGLSLVFAGAVGNIIDSVFYGLLFDYSPLFYGKVVDMFYFPLFSGFWPNWVPFLGGDYFVFFRPVFNVADASITIGAVFLLFFQKQLSFK
jgi:signal peptidase II